MADDSANGSGNQTLTAPLLSSTLEEALVAAPTSSGPAENNDLESNRATTAQAQQQLSLPSVEPSSASSFSPKLRGSSQQPADLLVTGGGTREEPSGPGRFQRGHKFCGGCCDIRRAVIAVDCTKFGLTVYGFCSVLIVKYLLGSIRSAMKDDPVIAAFDTQALEELMQELPIGWFIVETLATLILMVVGVYGALRYNVYMVGLAMLDDLYKIHVGISQRNLFGIMFAIFFIYPHVVLIKEIRQGIMSKANYKNERSSCCCV